MLIALLWWVPPTGLLSQWAPMLCVLTSPMIRVLSGSRLILWTTELLEELQLATSLPSKLQIGRYPLLASLQMQGLELHLECALPLVLQHGSKINCRCSKKKYQMEDRQWCRASPPQNYWLWMWSNLRWFLILRQLEESARSQPALSPRISFLVLRKWIVPLKRYI